MRILILLLCLGATSCGKKPAPSCDAVADHVQELHGTSDPYVVGLRGAFALRCAEDVWSDEMRRCIAGTKSMVEPQNCKQKLMPDQAKKFDLEIEAVEQRAAMTIIPGACLRYEKMLAAVMTCDALPKEARDQLQRNFDTFKASWPTIPDKRSIEPICSSAIETVKGAAGTCPGAASW